MEISFETSKLQKLCNSDGKLKGEFGPVMAKRVRQRLIDLEASETLAEMRALPGRCHELAGDRHGELAMDLVHPMRLIFTPDHDPIPLSSGGGMDWSQVTRIRILEIADYH